MSTNAQGNEITSWAVTYRAELAGKAIPGQAKRGWTMTNLMRKAIRNPARATAVFCLIWPGLMAAQSLGIDSIQPQNPSQVRSSYVLGPDDQIVIRVSELEDINDKPILVDTNGQLYLPLVGPVQVAGLTVQQLRQQLTDKLRKYIKEPAVSISVLEFRSQPVSVLGSVGAPGVLQLRGNKNLYEVLSMAGGIKPDAGNSVRITRRIENGVIPLTGATTDPTGKFSLAEVVLKDVMEAKRPEENIEIKPNDVISVPKGEMIYVVGEVRVSGGLALGERKTISILEALSMAGGLGPTANSGNAKVLRTLPGKAQREEITVNLSSIMKGKSRDISMQANDILVVSGSTGKKLAAIAIPSIVSAGVFATTK